MSQFHLSDEDDTPKKAAPTPPPSPSAETNSAGFSFSGQDLPEKASEFHFFPGEESAQENSAPPTPPASAPGATAAAPSSTPTPSKSAARPLQPRAPGGAPIAPKPKAPVQKSAIATDLTAQVDEENKHILTAQQLNMEPTDGFSAAIFGFGATLRGALDLLEPVATWLMRILIPVGALCLAYILAAIFMGGAKEPSGARFADVLRFSTLAATGLKWSLLGVGVSTAILAYADRRYGAIIAGLGMALAFGSPLALKALLGPNNPVAAVVARDLRVAGTVLLWIGVFKAVCDLISVLMELPAKMREKHASVGAGRPIEAKQRQIARDANMFSPCWELPFCRESVRKLCPAFLAKKRCWKFGRGCYCDEEMMGRIVRGEPIEVIKAPTKMSRQKPPCGNCYIYLEHQGHKFRMLSPLTLPATIAFCFFVQPVYAKVFQSFYQNFDKFFSTLSFDASKFTPDAIKANPEALKKASEAAADSALLAGWAQNCLGVVLGFLALIYISKGIEWAIFKAKL